MSLWRELKRRNVAKVGFAYLVASWLIVQIVSVLTDPLSLPDNLDTVVVVLLAIGFPFALIAAWIFEVTPDGLRVTPTSDSTAPVASATGKKLTYAVGGMLVAAIALLGIRTIATDPGPDGFGQGSRIAILPCTDLSPDPTNSFFAAGIQVDLIDRLKSLSGLEVVSELSTRKYEGRQLPAQEIAAELGVDAVMSCSARYSGSSVVLALQLNDGRSDTVLWSERYESDLGDVFLVQSNIARNVLDALSIEFSLAEQQRIEQALTSSPQAYEYYLRSLVVEESDPAQGDSQLAHDYLDQALALDPNFALAYARKAFIYSQRLYYGGFGVAPETRPSLERNALENISNALSIDPMIGLAHAALAGVHEVGWNWTQARDAYLRAMQLAPDDPDVVIRYAFFNRALGEYTESAKVLQRAIELDPGEGSIAQYGISQMMARNFEAALEAFDDVLAINPNQNNTISRAHCLNALGRFDEAIEALDAAENLGLSDSGGFRLAGLAMGYANAGRREEADRHLNRIMALGSGGAAAHLAMAYVALGDADNGYIALRQAIESRTIGNLIALIELKANFWGNPILETPRFRELLDQIGAVD